MLNDAQIDRLQIILRDETLLAIIEKVFLNVIENNKPESTPSDSDELLGQKYRGYELAKTILLKGFDKILTYKKSEKTLKTFNKAI